MRIAFIFICCFIRISVFGQIDFEGVDTTTYEGMMIRSNRSAIKGDYKEMLRYAEKAITMGSEEAGEESWEYINALGRKGSALMMLSQFEASSAMLDLAISIVVDHKDTLHMDYGHLLRIYGNLSMSLGDYDQAGYFFRRAKQCFPEDHDYYDILNNQIAYIDTRQGNLEEALLRFQNSVNRERSKLKNSLLNPKSKTGEQALDVKISQGHLSTALHNAAYIYRKMGQLQKALPLMEESMALVLEIHGKQHFKYENRAFALVDVYTQLGQHQKSIDLSLEALSISKNIYQDNYLPIASALHRVALSYIGANEAEAALTYALEALEVYEQYELDKHDSKASLLIDIGKIYRALGDLDRALIHIETAQALIIEQFGQSHTSFEISLNEQAAIYVQLGRHEESLALMKKVKEGLPPYFRENITIYPSIILNKAWAHERLGEVEGSAAEYTELNAVLTEQIFKQFDFFSEQEQFDWVKKISPYKNEIQSFSLRHQQLLRSDGIALNAHLQFAELALSNQKKLLETIRNSNDPELIKNFQEWSLLQKILSEAYTQSSTSNSQNIDSLEFLSNTLENVLARKSQPFKKSRTPVNWEDIRNQLKEGEASIAFSSFPYQEAGSTTDSVVYVAYLIKRDMETPRTIYLFEKKQLPNLKLTKQLYVFPTPSLSNNLHSLIYQPLADELEGIQTIYYSCSGLIHRINLGAISISASETMADHFRLVQLGNIRQLLSTDSPKIYKDKSAVLFGGINYARDTIETEAFLEGDFLTGTSNMGSAFRSFRGGEWDQLEWSTKEVETIKTKLEHQHYQVACYQADEATEEVFKAMNRCAASPRIIHLATHGYFFPNPENIEDQSQLTGFETSKHPLIRSGLILAGANHAWKGKNIASNTEDGILTAFEISKMNLSNTELVVLSACETGLGDIEGDEGVYGLQRAFKMAGVKYILMSLWNVKDKKTYEFMSLFYESIDSGKSIPEAYKTAQSGMQQKYALPFNPRNWAGFVLLE